MLDGEAQDLLEALVRLGGLLVHGRKGEEEYDDVGDDEEDGHPRQTGHPLFFVSDGDQHADASGRPFPRRRRVGPVGARGQATKWPNRIIPDAGVKAKKSRR